MEATQTIEMSDLSGNKRFRTGLEGDITPEHTVGQAVDYYLQQRQIPKADLRWSAFSRGVRVDLQEKLADLPADDAQLTVMPEVTAGAR